jgi:quercetin dioxygenase-like cupin family protein
MSKAGDVIENPVTGERGVARIGTEETGGQLLVADRYIRPGGAVMGEHLHPAIEERFTVLRGWVGFRLAGRESIAERGVRLIAPAGAPHDWRNAGPEEALVRVEIRPAARRFLDALSAIIRNDYLSFAYERFSKHRGALVVFGHSLNPEFDQHLIDAMRRWKRYDQRRASFQRIPSR